MTTWRIVVDALDQTDAPETIELTDAEAWCYVGEAGVGIQTNPDGMGGFRDERVIPWRRVLDYKKTS